MSDRDIDLIHTLSDSFAAGDYEAVLERMHPDVVWEHNLGTGSLEDGVYIGRESVQALLERIVEPWEHMRAEIDEVRDLGQGRYEVRGELHAKHSTSASEVRSPYVQHFEVDEGLLIRGRMKTLGALE